MIPLLSAPNAGMVRSEFPGRCLGCGKVTDWSDSHNYQCQRCKSIQVFRAQAITKWKMEHFKPAGGYDSYWGGVGQQALSSSTKPPLSPPFPSIGSHVCPKSGIQFCCKECSMETTLCSEPSSMTCWAYSDAPQEERMLSWSVQRRKAVANQWGIKYETPCGCNKCELGKVG